MPDYELEDPKKVAVRLTGEVLDENYTRLLLEGVELDLMDVITLDKIQRRWPIDDAFRRLKAQKLIEGRRPNLFVSAKIAVATGEKAAYIKNRAGDGGGLPRKVRKGDPEGFERSAAEQALRCFGRKAAKGVHQEPPSGNEKRRRDQAGRGQALGEVAPCLSRHEEIEIRAVFRHRDRPSNHSSY